MQEITLKIFDFEKLGAVLENERLSYIKLNAISEEDFSIRSLEDCKKTFEFFKELHFHFNRLFSDHPSLIELFEKDFVPFSSWRSLDSILDQVFVDEYVFAAKEMLPLNLDNKLSQELLDSYLLTLKQWIEEKQLLHINARPFIDNGLSIELKSSDLPCQCEECISFYRTRIREIAFDEVEVAIKNTEDKLKSSDFSLNDAADIYNELRRILEKIMFKIRYKVKRSSLNKLEAQIKHILKEKFYYPAPAAKFQGEKVTALFVQLLKKQHLRSDLISEEEYARYFTQISSNIWRPDSFLEREFQKFLSSLLLLKRKDISASILTEHLGTFWIHSNARRINRKIVYHMGPTNSGKTYHAIEALSKVPKGCYLAPLRLLAAELYDTLNAKGVVTTLLTGEEVIELDGATHYSSTVEMAKLNEEFDCCVIDEIQMIADPQRGWAWTRALVNIFAPEVHVCGDSSVRDLVEKVVELTGDTLEIRDYERMTELKVEEEPVILADLERSDALIVFSRKNALKHKADLEQLGFKVSIVYGRLSPEVRREQARKFDQGETDIIVATDAISMGMNLPIRRIIFSTLRKYIENQEYLLTDSEIKQIAGRCGRFNRFPVGYVTCLSREEDGLSKINAALKVDLIQKTQAMVGPDLEIFAQVNDALKKNSLPELKLSEFLRLFNTMKFQAPFFGVDLKEMIELAEMVEDANSKNILSNAEIFGFACAPVNLGDPGHVQYYVWILNRFANTLEIDNEEIDHRSDDIDYLETSIKCVELYQWLSRHFKGKLFNFKEADLLGNKGKAIERLNELLSEKIIRSCASCGTKLPDQTRFNICDNCFQRRYKRRDPPSSAGRQEHGQRDEPRHRSSGGSSAGRSYAASRAGAAPKSEGERKDKGNRRGKQRFKR